MKKLLIAAVCFTAIISMSSCTEDSSNENPTTTSKVGIEKTTDIKADGGDDVNHPKPKP